MADETTEQSTDPIKLATELTVAWLSNPNSQASADDVPAFLEKMLTKINSLTGQSAPAEAAPEHKPAVPVRSSVKADYLISLIDGRKLKSLKRHLSSHGLSPKEYRERYGLKPDYPMVAPSYSAVRRAVAEKLGLGKKVVSKAATSKPAATKTAPAKRAAQSKAAAQPKPVPTKAAAPADKPAAAKTSAKPAPAAKKPASPATQAKPAAAKAKAPAAPAKAKAPAKAAAPRNGAAKPATAAPRGGKKPATASKAAPAAKSEPTSN